MATKRIEPARAVMHLSGQGHAESIPEIGTSIHGKGAAGAVRIGKLLEPVRQIINHPDRNRLMAEFFKDYK